MGVLHLLSQHHVFDGGFEVTQSAFLRLFLNELIWQK